MQRLIFNFIIIIFLILTSNIDLYAAINEDNNTLFKDYNSRKLSLRYYEGDKIEAGCYSDNIYLNIYLSTDDRSFQMQILNFGMILNIEDENTRKNIVGIEYPIIRIIPPPPPNIDEQRVEENQKEEMERRLNKRTSHLIFIDNNGNRTILNKDNEKGIYANITNEPQRLEYKIKVPLKYFTKKISIVNISLKTPNIDYKSLKDKYGIPKEDRSNGKVPPENSQFKPTKMEINILNIKMTCSLK